MSFSGFTDEDIRKVKNNEIQKTEKTIQNQKPRKKVAFKNVTSAKPNSLLSKTEDKINEKIAENVKPTEDEPQAKGNVPKVDTQDDQNGRKPIDLDEFEVKQKYIEEQNRRRKELLAKALADRTKKTQEEAQRLDEIKNEFKKLDDILSSDVNILRKQIETATIEYTECEKRYHKIEREFLAAKLLLHQKLERKELLTEHLCAIIEKNEERKAEKLTELLTKLKLNSFECDETENSQNVE